MNDFGGYQLPKVRVGEKKKREKSVDLYIWFSICSQKT